MSSHFSFRTRAAHRLRGLSVVLASGVGLMALPLFASAQNYGTMRGGQGTSIRGGVGNGGVVTSPMRQGNVSAGIPYYSFNRSVFGNGANFSAPFVRQAHPTVYGPYNVAPRYFEGQRIARGGTGIGRAPIGSNGGRPFPEVRISRSVPVYHNYEHWGRYSHGIPDGVYSYSDWCNYYFANSWAFYPYYLPYYVSGVTVLSPYSFYYGVVPPYIDGSYVGYAPPADSYVPVPLYANGAYQGWQSNQDQGYYLNQDANNGNSGSAQNQGFATSQDSNQNQTGAPGRSAGTGQNGDYHVGEAKSAAKHDESLDAAIADIKLAWKSREIDALAKHLRTDGRIAVYLRGHYQYSMDGNDYLDMTKDAFRTTTTVSFTLDNVEQKENGIYTVSGTHVYRDKEDKEHTVYLNYVLAKSDDKYNIIQIGATPDHIEE